MSDSTKSTTQDKLADLKTKISKIGIFNTVEIKKAGELWACTAYSRNQSIAFHEEFATEEDADQCAIAIIDSRTTTQSE